MCDCMLHLLLLARPSCVLAFRDCQEMRDRLFEVSDSKTLAIHPDNDIGRVLGILVCDLANETPEPFIDTLRFFLQVYSREQGEDVRDLPVQSTEVCGPATGSSLHPSRCTRPPGVPSRGGRGRVEP